MKVSSRARRSTPALWLVAGILVAPALASAHAVVYPRSSAPGAYEKYVLRVPNEKGVPTTRVELRFPAGVRVVSFGDVPGWQLETITDSARNVIGAVWTGILQPARFVELPFIAVNPRTDTRLVWPAFQTYADGERVEWTGPEESNRPASSTVIAASSDAASPASRLSIYLATGAMLLALVSLGLALRPASRARGQPA